jgi:hypothetical protein
VASFVTRGEDGSGARGENVTSRPRRRVLVVLLALAVLGHAHWFFGNLYEAVVLIPQFAASPEQRLPISAGGILAPGSPVLYYAPMVPLTVPAALAALAVGWRFGREVRGKLLGAAVLSVSAALLTAYIVTRLNFPLFFDPSTGVARLEVLLRRWALLNYVRVGLVGAALVLLLLALVSATRSARTPSSRDGVR